jgi:very-short-patch-repair endonuclease/ribosomal protein L30/L7E
MVDSASDTNTLRATGDGAFEQTKKRYNVAASRARDQLWVIHSFDPELHLKAVDIRYRLLQHVKDPDSSLRNYEQQVGRTESPFEKEVLKRLTNAGFRVTTQVEVGYFRIDMVVEGEGKRLAIECDGDRYHPIEKLAEDMNRQAILERLGWRFSRIRGSAFYRNPDQAMEAVFKRLDELEILPNTLEIGEKGYKDNTLIEELKSIISEGFQDDPFKDSSTINPDSATKILSTEVERISTIELPEGDQAKKWQSPKIELDKNSQIENSLFANYAHYTEPACGDPRTSNEATVSECLLGVIKIENPIQVKRAFDIYLRSCGIKRMGHELKDDLLKSLDFLKKSGLIHSHNYSAEDDALNEVVWIAGSPPEVLRNRGDRTLEEIPLGELYAITQKVASVEGVTIGSEEHLRATLEALNLKRLTTTAERILNQAISGEFLKL